MKIAGLQKLSMVDYPGALCCTVFLSGCQLRCPYCHNAALIPPALEASIPEDAFFEFLAARRGRLTAVTVSGGEPLLSPGLEPFLKRIKDAGYLVKLDTNGMLPGLLKSILDKRLVDYVAMDIKAAPDNYAAAAGVPVELDRIRESVALLIGGETDYEFRTTAVKGLHTPGDFAAITDLIRGAKAYYIQKFVDSGALLCSGLEPLSDEEMRISLGIAQKTVENSQLRGM